ncbi:MAG: MGMT family protein [Verrucomicrobia bacterium]|nr:MGMT family protein [Verrucomicrobiota bacterium]
MSAKYQRKTWREKLADDKGLPKIGKVEGKLRKTWGTGTMVIPAPREVDAMIRKIRKGRTATINDLRSALAKKHGVDICCPITTGIFAWIAAHAAAEDEAEGKKRITPWWRVLKSDGKLNPKYPGGVVEQATRLKAEGIEIEAGKGKKPPRVKDWENHLAKTFAVA